MRNLAEPGLSSKSQNWNVSDTTVMCKCGQLLKLGAIKPFVAKAMQPPSSEAIDHAVEMLFDLVSAILTVLTAAKHMSELEWY